MPAGNQSIPGIPGKQGIDYEVVEYNGQHYVVYKTKLPGGALLMDAWKISPKDFKGLNIKTTKHITRAQFKNLEVFGDFGEIAARGANEKPLQTWLKGLKETYGSKVSWIQDEEYMATFFAGYLEGLDPGVIQQQLKRTKWYQSRTQAQRVWELDLNRADRKQQVGQMETQVREALQDMYGTLFNDQGFSDKQIKEWAYNIASGKFGDPSGGFQEWVEDQTNAAEKVEGSNAWISREQSREEQRQFMNRPEDMFEQIRDDALGWLGPGQLPDRETLIKWSQDLVSGVRSESDWEGFMQKTARDLHPWLGPNERWQERASIYKNIVEDELGRSIGFDDKLLKGFGAVDANGQPLNTTMSFDDFSRKIRQTDEWWGSTKAEEEGFELFNYLNNTFNGVAS
jgi:hypothetical protein